VQETHNRLTGVCANVLNHAAVLTDQDALLGGFFDQDGGIGAIFLLWGGSSLGRLQGVMN
jgi:hypothetical protein